MYFGKYGTRNCAEVCIDIQACTSSFPNVFKVCFINKIKNKLKIREKNRKKQETIELKLPQQKGV